MVTKVAKVEGKNGRVNDAGVDKPVERRLHAVKLVREVAHSEVIKGQAENTIEALQCRAAVETAKSRGIGHFGKRLALKLETAPTEGVSGKVAGAGTTSVLHFEEGPIGRVR